MTKLEKIKGTLKSQKSTLNKEYGISEIGIFGSFVRGEEKKGSDLDILVQIDNTMGLLGFIGLENHLSRLLGVKVDLVMKDVLKPAIAKQVMNEVVFI